MSQPTTPLPKKASEAFGKPPAGWRRSLYNVIFEADTPAGRTFDIALVFVILISILVVVLDSIPALHGPQRPVMSALEWFFTALFSVEYLARQLVETGSSRKRIWKTRNCLRRRMRATTWKCC